MKKSVIFSLIVLLYYSVYGQQYIQTTSSTTGAVKDIIHVKTLSIGHTNTLNLGGKARLNLWNEWGNWMSLVDGYSNDVYGFHNPNNGGRMELFITDGETGSKNFGVFTIKNDGNIGMGTNSPEGKLDVRGETYINGGWLRIKGNNGLFFQNYGGGFHMTDNNWIRTYGNKNFYHNTGTMRTDGRFEVGPSGNRFVVSSNNVGIGTSNPTARLHVNNGDNSYGSILANANESPFSLYTKTLTTQPANVESFRLGLKYGTNENNGFISFYRGGSSSGGFLGFATSGSERLRISANGNVGIGAPNPAAKLHVSEGVQFRKTTVGLTTASADNSWIRDDWMTGNYGPAKWDQTKKKWVRPAGGYNDIGGIIFQDEGTYFLREKAGTKLEYTNQELLDTSFMFADIFSGNVGIGCDRNDTDFQNYKFSVNGNIRAKEVKVYTGWADYVFEDSYDLPTLTEVEQHITEKGHLINIPSSEKVAKEGIYLGEMNAKLLEKIEELTLYTIQQEKEIKKQEEKINQQQKEIDQLKDQNTRLAELEEKLNNFLNSK